MLRRLLREVDPLELTGRLVIKNELIELKVLEVRLLSVLEDPLGFLLGELESRVAV